MGSGTVLWAGKQLRGGGGLHQGARPAPAAPGAHEAAEGFARFLPERAAEWTPDELELGAHAGPWLKMEVEPRAD